MGGVAAQLWLCLAFQGKTHSKVTPDHGAFAFKLPRSPSVEDSHHGSPIVLPPGLLLKAEVNSDVKDDRQRNTEERDSDKRMNRISFKTDKSIPNEFYWIQTAFVSTSSPSLICSAFATHGPHPFRYSITSPSVSEIRALAITILGLRSPV